MMRRLLSLCAIAFGGSFYMMAQTIIIDRPIVNHPTEEKYKVVEASNMLHAVEGSYAIYKISVDGLDSIESVSSCKYTNHGETVDITSNCSLEKGILKINDITISNLKANETQDFKITLIVREKGKKADTELSAEAMAIKVYSMPTQEVISPSYFAFCEKTGELLWSAKGEGGDKWDYSWTSTERTSSKSTIFNHPSITNSGTSEKDVEVTLKATNYAPDGKTAWDTFERSWVIKVFPKPNVGTSVNPNKEERPEKKFQKDSWDLAVSTAGGNMEGWKIEWRDADNGNLLGQNKEYKLTSTATNRIYTKHVILHVTNNAPNDAQPGNWFEGSYDYYIRFYPVPEVQFANAYPQDVMDGYEATMLIKPVDGMEQLDDYVINYDWGAYSNSNSNVYHYSASNKNNDNGIKDDISVKCTFGLKDSDAKAGPKQLSHTFTVWPQPKVTVSDNNTTPSTPKLLYQDGNWDLSVSSSGGYRNGWKYVWKDENGKVIGNNKRYTLLCDNINDEIQEKHIILTVTNELQGDADLWFSQTYDYYAKFYPVPIVTFKNGYPKNIKHGDKVALNIMVQDTKGNDVGDAYNLSCSWNPKSEGQEAFYEYTGVNPSNNNGVKVSIRADITVELKGMHLPKYYNLQADIMVWPKPVVDFSGISDCVGCGGQSIDFSVVANGGKKDGWSYQWIKNEQRLDVNTNTYKMNLDNAPEDGVVHNEYMVKVVNTCDGEIWLDESFPFNVTVYPTPRIPEGIILIDKNRGTEVSIGIREGNDLTLHCDDCSGGYPNGWSYKWMRNDEELCAQNVYDETVHSGYTGYGKANDLLIKYSCYVENLYNTIPWMQQNYSREIRVYRKPQTPTGLQRKGNGTSGTWIATCGIDDSSLDSNDYYLVFGYRDANGNMHDVSTMSQQNVGEQRWSTSMTSSGYADGRNNAYVYALWKYSDGVEITSGLCLESHVEEEWDGSTYNGTTRSVIADITGISTIPSINTGSGDSEFYTINGQKSSHIMKGVNIIRRNDGQVVKYYNNK